MKYNQNLKKVKNHWSLPHTLISQNFSWDCPFKCDYIFSFNTDLIYFFRWPVSRQHIDRRRRLEIWSGAQKLQCTLHRDFLVVNYIQIWCMLTSSSVTKLSLETRSQFPSSNKIRVLWQYEIGSVAWLPGQSFLPRKKKIARKINKFGHL
jgi:hypothetical protein